MCVPIAMQETIKLAFISRAKNHPSLQPYYGVSVFSVYFSRHEPPYDHIWRAHNQIFCHVTKALAWILHNYSRIIIVHKPTLG